MRGHLNLFKHVLFKDAAYVFINYGLINVRTKYCSQWVSYIWITQKKEKFLEFTPNLRI